jgi:hypothetical protein
LPDQIDQPSAAALRQLIGWRVANVALVSPDLREAVLVVHDEFPTVRGESRIIDDFCMRFFRS